MNKTVLTVSVVAVVAVAGYFVWKYYSKKSPVIVTPPAVTATSQPQQSTDYLQQITDTALSSGTKSAEGLITGIFGN